MEVGALFLDVISNKSDLFADGDLYAPGEIDAAPIQGLIATTLKQLLSSNHYNMPVTRSKWRYSTPERTSEREESDAFKRPDSLMPTMMHSPRSPHQLTL